MTEYASSWEQLQMLAWWRRACRHPTLRQRLRDLIEHDPPPDLRGPRYAEMIQQATRLLELLEEEEKRNDINP